MINLFFKKKDNELVNLNRYDMIVIYGMGKEEGIYIYGVYAVVVNIDEIIIKKTLLFQGTKKKCEKKMEKIMARSIIIE